MSHIHDSKIRELEIVANRVRRHVISMLAEAGSGHPAGALGMADIFVAMYFHLLHHDPKNPEWPERDRLILSNGHICPARYATMAEAGYFPVDELKTLRRLGSRLQGHPERHRLSALETTSGPLGAGLAQSCGLALAAKMDDAKWRTYCLTSDGEHDCGLHWEAVLFAGGRKLNNLTVIVDRNNIQLDGPTEQIMPLEPLREKYEAFGWHVIDINGNDIREAVEAVNQAKAVFEKPTVILAHTIPGRGVSFMEGDFKWHGATPTMEEAGLALRELQAREDSLRSEH